MTELYNSLQMDQHQFWDDTTTSQLDSIYSSHSADSGMPARQDIIAASRYFPHVWDPVSTLVLADGQSQASYDEQQLALRTFKYTLDKYRAVDGELTYTKNVIVHGAPGAGKSYLGQCTVLYALSLGLRVITTALMGARASCLGGVHLHRLFCLRPEKNATRPYRTAELAIQKLMGNHKFLHALLTVDVIFLDECGQVSAEQIAVFDIILRKLRKSHLPFGGVLLIGTMDHTQLQPINALPFLLSTLVITSFTMVQLRHSVRASADSLFQEFQQILRTNPFQLRESSELRARFFELGSIFTFVDSMDAPEVTPSMTQMYARKSFVKSATAMYTASLISKLNDNGTEHYIRRSVDNQVRSHTRAEYQEASESAVKSLNNALREPAMLVFYRLGLYEITTNDTTNDRYNQSNIAILFDMPSSTALNSFASIALLVAPSGTDQIDFLDNEEPPTKEQLINRGWKEVSVGLAPEQNVTCRNGIQAKRKQYALKHIGATTVHKAMGATIVNGLAFECSSDSTSPWERSQAIVGFSRTKTSAAMIVVGDREYAMRRIWQIITLPTQWTLMMENILEMVTINAETPANANLIQQQQQHSLRYSLYYPFQVRNAMIPSDSTGFVYILISRRNKNFTYIGETENLCQRITEHQTGHGAIGTANPMDRPFQIAGYVAGLKHLTETQRMGLENQWRYYRNQLLNDDPYEIINQGLRVVQNENANAEVNGRPERINFVCLVEPRSVDQNGDDDDEMED